MEDHPYEKVICRQIPVQVPVIVASGPRRVDQEVGDALRILHVVRPGPNLEEWVVAGARAVGRGRVELQAGAPQLTPAPARGQRPVLALDVVDNHAPRPAQQRGQDEANTLTGSSGSERQNVLRPVMAKVVNGSPVAPGSDVDARVSAEESGRLEIDPSRPACGSVRVRAGPSLLGAATGDDKPDDNSKRAQDRHDPQARLPGSGRA